MPITKTEAAVRLFFILMFMLFAGVLIDRVLH